MSEKSEAGSGSINASCDDHWVVEARCVSVSKIARAQRNDSLFCVFDVSSMLVYVQDSDSEKSSLIVSDVANGSDASMGRSGDDCTDEKSRIMSLVVMCNAKESGVA
jgi:predicted component of type VI protein secretion system